MSKRGLGRGLASLIPDSAFDSGGSPVRSTLRHVPLDEIEPNPDQPRKTFDVDALADLSRSIEEHGILSPLVVHRENGRYILVAGERRLRAAGLAGLTEVPVIVRELSEDSSSLEIALVENLQREDLDPIEAARGYQRLIEEFGMTQEEVARRVGKGRPTVANALRLLRLPEMVLSALRDGRITAGHARALLPLTDVDELRTCLAKIIAQQLSVRATERLVARLTRADPVVRTVERRSRERTYAYATNLLVDALQTSVAIRPRKDGSGRIVLDYADSEDLERLIALLRHREPTLQAVSK